MFTLTITLTPENTVGIGSSSNLNDWPMCHLLITCLPTHLPYLPITYQEKGGPRYLP